MLGIGMPIGMAASGIFKVSFSSVVRSDTSSMVSPQISSARACTLALGTRPDPAAGSGSSSARHGTVVRRLHAQTGHHTHTIRRNDTACAAQHSTGDQSFHHLACRSMQSLGAWRRHPGYPADTTERHRHCSLTRASGCTPLSPCSNAPAQRTFSALPSRRAVQQAGLSAGASPSRASWRPSLVLVWWLQRQAGGGTPGHLPLA